MLPKRLHTVKPLMFAYPLFRKFRQLNKTTKFKSPNINNIPNLFDLVCCLKIVWFHFTKIQCAKTNLRVTSPAFKAANLKGFTV